MASRWTGTPAYLKIAADYRTKILNGSLAAGAKLPSESQLMNEYDVSRQVVKMALIEVLLTGAVAAALATQLQHFLSYEVDIRECARTELAVLPDTTKNTVMRTAEAERVDPKLGINRSSDGVNATTLVDTAT